MPPPVPRIRFGKPNNSESDTRRPERVHREIGTRAEVLEQAWPAHGYPVGLPAGGFYPIVAIKSLFRTGEDFLHGRAGSLTALRDLLFKQHQKPPNVEND